ACVRAGEECVLAGERERADGTLDDVGVDFDAAVVKEQAQPCPAGERVADRLGELALLADEGELLVQPRLERLHHRSATDLAGGTALLRRATANLALDLVERRDAGQRLHGDRRRAGLGQLVKAAAYMRPAEGKPDVAAFGQHLVSAIAVDLQHTPEAGEMRD